MTTSKLNWSLLTAALLFSCAMTTPAAAKQFGNFEIDTEMRTQGIGTKNSDLGTSGEDFIGSGSLEGRLKVTTHFNDNALLFWDLRGVGSVGRGGYESSDSGSVSSGENSFLEMKQLYAQFSNVGAEQGMVRLGRQKIREDYGMWWNDELDSVSAMYDTTLFKGRVAAGQNIGSWRTGSGDFLEEDEDLFDLLAEGSWQYYYDHFFEARAMMENDHSDIAVGDVQTPNDFDNADGQLYWAGVRAAGKTASFMNGADKMAYRVDLLTVWGDEDVATNGACGPNTCITAVNNEDVSGWAFDASADIPLANAAPIIHLGYAYGSGDDGGNDSDAFRQPGLSGNFSKFGALSENTENYGTVLRPELSNIHIVSAGATMPVLEASNFGFIYRYYRLAEDATSLADSNIFNTLTGTDKDLGQGVDILFNSNLTKDISSQYAAVQDASFRSSLGFFRSGDAYGAADGEIAVRGLVELKVGF